jgi:hypothetical protein
LEPLHARESAARAAMGLDLLARGAWPLLLALILLLFSSATAALARFNPLARPEEGAAHPLLASLSSLLLGLASASGVYGLQEWVEASRLLEEAHAPARMGRYASQTLAAGLALATIGMLALGVALHLGGEALLLARVLLAGAAGLTVTGWLLEVYFYAAVLPRASVGGAAFSGSFRAAAAMLAILGLTAMLGVAAGPLSPVGVAMLVSSAVAGVAFVAVLLHAVDESKRGLSRIIMWAGAPPVAALPQASWGRLGGGAPKTQASPLPAGV